MSIIMDATLIFSGVNVLLLGALLYPSARNVQKTRSSITIALMLFVIIFLLETSMSIFLQFKMMPLYPADVELQVLALSVLKTLSFGMLLWVTYK
ncbi:MAG: hypothetical protein HYU39_09575 [Thaumarchaeota archaeon]|nr:hypothetical protein [Nitrososphaerota archaeon]